jgi:hypothetical protein
MHEHSASGYLCTSTLRVNICVNKKTHLHRRNMLTPLLTTFQEALRVAEAKRIAAEEQRKEQARKKEAEALAKRKVCVCVCVCTHTHACMHAYIHT